ncbi:hypothetical protein KYY02_19430 [Streptomyces pimonensis]|uniref:Uncharacterized protein n=1 Tax=Streptomyces pimonensis TaxID=2860288 RepID=A0ABV4J1I5_9ACTN
MTEPVIPMSEEAAKEEAARLIASAYQPTTFRDDTPTPEVGDAPPVPQPGRPPMSQGATDASVLILAGGGAFSMVSLSAGVLMYLSQYADPIVCGIVFGAPTTLFLALARLAKRVRPEPEVHQHFHGDVTQTTVNAKNTGVWAKNINGR